MARRDERDERDEDAETRGKRRIAQNSPAQ
jgi:hypothetical protein